MMPVLRRSLRWIAVDPFAAVVRMLARVMSCRRGRPAKPSDPSGGIVTQIVVFKPRGKNLRLPLDPAGAMILPFRPRVPVRLEASEPPARTGS